MAKYNTFNKQVKDLVKKGDEIGWNKVAIEELKALHSEVLVTLKKKVDKIPPQTLATTLGIITDKLLLLEGKPTTKSASLHLKVDGSKLSTDEIKNILIGKKDSKTINLKDKS